MTTNKAVKVNLISIPNLRGEEGGVFKLYQTKIPVRKYNVKLFIMNLTSTSSLKCT